MGLFDRMDPYNPVQISGAPSDGYQEAFQRQKEQAFRPVRDFSAEINQGVRDQSNLMGPKDEENPLSSALSRRGDQVYGSAVNQLMRRADFDAENRKMGLQKQSIDNQAAMYQNAQSRAQINFQQIAYQREAALAQEIMRRQLFGQLFGGLGQIGGAMAAKGMYNARHKAPIEGQYGSIPASASSMPGSSPAPAHSVYPDPYGRNF